MSAGNCTYCRRPGAERKPYSRHHVCVSCEAGREAAARAALVALARRVARLNPNCAEIGAGMLASLVQDAKAALIHAGEVAS